MRIGVLAAFTAAALMGLPGAASAAQLFPSVPAPAGAHSELLSTTTVAPDTVRYSYRYGPLVAAPGQNLILNGPLVIERPAGPGYITRLKPNLVGEDGTVPPVEQVHMHHAIFGNLSRPDITWPGGDVPQGGLPERIFAFAEEKTTLTLPPGFGYALGPSDATFIEYMLHNETPQTRVVWITYDMDWVPKASPTGLTMKTVNPIWMDVENGKIYPVFDVHQGSGHNGLFTYPDDQPDAYTGRPKVNEWTADRDMTLVDAGGHLHPGGLWVDLSVTRNGRTAHLFRSNANYFDPGGPLSWDMAMDLTPPDWRVAIRKGDTLRVSTTYDTTRASWYENMGIMVVYAADGISGPDPFTHRVDVAGAPVHGHLREDGNYGGQPTGLPDATKLPDGQAVQNGVAIANFVYLPGDLSQTGSFQNPPVVGRGQSLRFDNFDSGASILHSVTACRQPCSGRTGVSYPLANGPVQFDSGQLGYGQPKFTAAAQRADWSTPANLPPGTYTFFCRVHPFMRGAFRVSGTPAGAARPAGSGAVGPSISIVSKSLRLDRHGRVPVRLRCNGSGGTCRGKLHLATVQGRRVVTLGSARFTVRAGRVTRVRVKLSRAKRALVRHRRSVPVLARARPSGGGATAAATLVLRAR